MALNAFSRTELLVGKPAMELLAQARVAVFGIGGVGGYTVEALARSGVGALDLIDDDRVCLTNINRQIYATRKTVGKYKVEVAKERILQINPNCQVETHCAFYMPDTAAQFDFTQYDYVVDAIDTVTGKLEMVEQAYRAGTPLISSMGAGNKMDPTAFEVADIYETSVCPLAKVMRHELRKRGIPGLKVVYSKEKPIAPKEDMANSCKTHCICPPGTARKCTQRRQVPGSNAFVPAGTADSLQNKAYRKAVSHTGFSGRWYGFCVIVILERNDQLHFELFFSVDSMGNVLGHNQCFTGVEQEYFSADGKLSGTLQHSHHCVTAGSVRGDFFALVKGKNGHADLVILYQRFADNLTGLIFHQIFQLQNSLLFNVLVHGLYPLSCFSSQCAA